MRARRGGMTVGSVTMSVATMLPGATRRKYSTLASTSSSTASVETKSAPKSSSLCWEPKVWLKSPGKAK